MLKYEDSSILALSHVEDLLLRKIEVEENKGRGSSILALSLFYLSPLTNWRWLLCIYKINTHASGTHKMLLAGKQTNTFLLQPYLVHTQRIFFRNLIKSTQNQIVFTIFRLIWIQTLVRLVANQSENGKYNLISGWINKIWKRFLCV